MQKSKKAKCADILKYNPEPTNAQVLQIVKDVGCSVRTVYRALEEVREANQMASKPVINGKNQVNVKNAVHHNNRKKASKGKKGRKKTIKGNITTPKSHQPKAIPPIDSNMTFEYFSLYYSYPFYNGLYRWQKEWFKTVWGWEYSLTLVSRDHGKSIGHGNVCEWAMAAKGWDILYLGWSSRRKDVADFVYQFFLQRKEVIVDKTSSNFHFKTTYGTKFDTYSVKSKEILGMHDIGEMNREIIPGNEYLEDYMRDTSRPLLMIIDDAIDDTFKDERHKEVKLEQFFKSTILNINPNKLMIVGTRKFEEDFYDFVQQIFKDDIIVYKRTPFLEITDTRYGKEIDNPSNLLCPERWIHDTHPDYNLYLDLKDKVKRRTMKLSGLTEYEKDLIKKKDLAKRREQVGEYWWHSEYCQNPHPITGDIWPNVAYQLNLETLSNYDLLMITIDRATTQNRNSDFTGIVVFMRNMKEEYLVIEDFTDKISIVELVPFIDKLYMEYYKAYGKVVKIYITIEKQGGGDDFIDLAQQFRWGSPTILLPVHNTRNKITRILDILEKPIQAAKIKFLSSLRNSELIKKEILVFPNQNKIDALDALANGIHQAEQIKNPKRQNDSVRNALRERRIARQNPSTLQEIFNSQNKNKRRSLFH